MSNEKLIVALDFSTSQEAENMITLLGDTVSFYKVGLELFLNSKGQILDFLTQSHKQIFLDLKFHDIPNTTMAASQFAARLDAVGMFNIHASGGLEMIKKSASVKRNDQILLAVTTLTSLDDHDIQHLFHSEFSASALALNLALCAQEGGADGVVCSALEASQIKHTCGTDFITVCPGIRFQDSSIGDQKRILSPREAIQNGADYLVMGRPITAANSPKDAALRVLDEIN